MDELDAPDVQAACRLVKDQNHHIPGELPSHDAFLLIASRQRARRDIRARRPDVELRDRPLGITFDGTVVAKDASRKRRLAVLRQDQVVLDREAEH